MNYKTLSRRVLTLILAALVFGAFACEERKPGAGVAATGKATAKKPVDKPKGPPGVTAKTIKIGSWGPLSGPAAAWGAVLHGMKAYFTYINDKGGINGRKIEFIYRDDQYNPAKTPGVVRELVEKEKVFAMVGGIGTANGRAVIDYLEKKGVPLFTPASGDKFWSLGGKKNVYTAFPRYVTEGEILGNYIGKELKAKKIAVLYQNDDFGKQGLEGLKKGLAKHDGSEVVAEVSCLPTDTNLSGHATKLAEKAPDALVLYAGPKQAITAVKTLAAQKKKPKHVLTSFVLSDPMMFKLAGKDWEGTVTAAALKLVGTDDPSVKLYEELIKKYGGGKLPVGTFTEAGFAFAMPFTEALQKAGKDLTRAKFYKALQGMKNWAGGGPYWKGGGLNPPITFSDKQRQGTDQIFLAQAKEGKWVKLTDWMGLGKAPTMQAKTDDDKAKKEAKAADKPKGDKPKPKAAPPKPKK